MQNTLNPLYSSSSSFTPKRPIPSNTTTTTIITNRHQLSHVSHSLVMTIITIIIFFFCLSVCLHSHRFLHRGQSHGVARAHVGVCVVLPMQPLKHWRRRSLMVMMMMWLRLRSKPLSFPFPG
jgi:hypothetical protein